MVVERAQRGCRIEVHDTDPRLIDGLPDGPFPHSGEGAVLTVPGSFLPAQSAKARGTRTAGGRHPAGAGVSGPDTVAETWNSEGDEGSGGAGESAESGPATRTADAPLDDSAGAARRSPPGRDLLLLRSLSFAAGCRPTLRGKAVWFLLPEGPRQYRK